MREKQAEAKGYRFTGAYDRDKEIIKEEAKELRKQGYKAVVCDVPDSKYSRGPKGIGYSIYAEPKFFIDREIKELNNYLNQIDSRKQYALDKYNKEVAEIEADKERMENRLKELTKNPIE